MRTSAQVQAALVDSLTRHVCESMDPSPSRRLMNTIITEWMIDMEIRFAPTELVNGKPKE